MKTTIEDKRLTERAIELISILKNPQNKTMPNKAIVLCNPVATGKSLLGLKITKVKFHNQEYLLKANRYLLVIILKYLIENNKIDLKKELPLKNNITKRRCLLNNRPWHADGYKMRDVLLLKIDGDKFYIESLHKYNS